MGLPANITESVTVLGAAIEQIARTMEIVRAAVDQAEAQAAPVELEDAVGVRNTLGAQAAALDLLKQDLAKLDAAAARFDRHRHDDAFRRALAKYPVITSYLAR